MTEVPDPSKEEKANFSQSIEFEVTRQIDHPLVDRLGFVETEGLQAIRILLIKALLDRADDSGEWMSRYQEEGQEVASLDKTGRAAVGLIVQTGLIRYGTGEYDLALEDFRDAYNYAAGMGFDDVLDELEELMRGAEARQPTSEFLVNVCRYVLSAEDCEELLAMPFEDALGYAYTLLLEGGEIEDPTVFFVERGLLE